MPPIPTTSGANGGGGNAKGGRAASRSFADHAIGFYLQLEDSLTPALKTAGDSYRKFVKVLDTYNRKAERSIGSAMDRLTKLVDGFGDLPQAAASAYTTAIAQLRRRIKPIKQPIELMFGRSGSKGFVTSLAQAIRQALERSRLTLRPRAPTKRAYGFDQSVALRRHYLSQVQPPDFVGAFRVPKFHKGGIVGGGMRAGQELIAKLEAGEMVLTRKATQKILKQAQRAASAAPEDIAAAVEQLYDQLALLKKAEQQVAKTGADPKAVAQYEAQLQKVEASFVHINREAKKLGYVEKQLLLKPLNEMVDTMAQYVEQVDDAVAGSKALAAATKATEKSVVTIGKNVKFLSAVAALKNIGAAFRNIHGQAAESFGVDSVGTFWEQMNEVNKTLHLSRVELNGLRKDALAANRGTRGAVDPAELGASWSALIDAGVRGKDKLAKLAPIVGALVTGFDVGGQNAAHLAKVLDTQLGMSADATAASFATLGRIASRTGISTDTLAASMAENAKAMGSTLTNLGPEGGRRALETMAKLQGGLTHVMGDQGSKLTDMIAQAAGGDVDSLTRMNQLLGSAFSSSSLGATLGSEGGASKILAALNERMKSSAGNAVGQQAFATALGATFTGAEFNTMLNNMGDMEAMQRDLADAAVANADGLTELAKSAEETQGWFTTLRKAASNVFSEWGGDHIVSFFKELNPIVLLSVAHLGQMLLPILPLVSKGLLAVGASLSAAIWPVTLIVAGVTALVGLFYYFRKELGAFMGGAWKGLQDSMAPMAKALGQIVVPFEKLFAWLGSGSDGGASRLEKFARAGEVFIKVFITPLVIGLQLIGGLIETIGNLFAGDWMGAMASFVQMGRDIATWLLSIVGLDFDSVAASIRNFFISLGQSITDHLLAGLNVLIEGYNGVTGWLGMDPIPLLGSVQAAGPAIPSASAIAEVSTPGPVSSTSFDTSELAAAQRENNMLLKQVVAGQRSAAPGNLMGPVRPVDPLVRGIAEGAY